MNTVLVLEDQRSQREIIANLLKNNGLNVSLASDRVETLAQIQGKCPDLVVWDLVRPRINGDKVCGRLKNAPLVICTGQGEKFARDWGRRNSVDGDTSKSFPPKKLISIVK